VRQSAVSRRIQALEDDLGVSLFERQSNGVRPTIAGHRFGRRPEIEVGIKREGQARRRACGLFSSRRRMPLFALTAYAKNERADLSQQDRNDFRRLTALLVETFKRRKR